MTCPFQICDWISLPFSTPNHLWPINSPVQLLFLPNRSDFPLSSLPLLLMDTFTLKIKRSPVELRKWSRKLEGYCKPHFSCNNYHPKEELINNDINFSWLQPCYSRWWGRKDRVPSAFSSMKWIFDFWFLQREISELTVKHIYSIQNPILFLEINVSLLVTSV